MIYIILKPSFGRIFSRKARMDEQNEKKGGKNASCYCFLIGAALENAISLYVVLSELYCKLVLAQQIAMYIQIYRAGFAVKEHLI